MAGSKQRQDGAGKMLDGTNGEELADRLQGARASVGLSMRRVAEELPPELALSHTTIANYESGRTFPSISALTALADVYGRPVDWFFQTVQPFTQAIVRHPKGKVSPRKEQRFKTRAHQWFDAYIKLERRLDCPLLAAMTRESLDGASPEELAKSLRDQLALDDNEAVPSVVELLEQFGIRVIEVLAPKVMESMVCGFGDEFAVVFNPATPSDRCRMLGLHELGHFLFGHHQTRRLDRKPAEDKTYEFASHLLLPESALQRVFANRNILELLIFKQNFGIPLSAMMFRANRSGLIDKKSARYLAGQFSKRGWTKSEPRVVRPDRATRFERLLETALADEQIGWAELEAITGISRDELEQRRELAVSMILGGYEAHGGDHPSF